MSQELLFLEKILIKSALLDERFLVTISSVVTRKLFSTKEAAIIYNALATHYKEYKTLMSKDMIVGTLDKADVRDDVLEYIKETDAIDFDIAKQYDYLIDATDKWLKQKSIQAAIMDAANIVTGKQIGRAHV